MMNASGYNGQMELNGSVITITRKGFVARSSHGKNEKQIPLNSVQAIDWKEASSLSRGFLKLIISGAIEGRQTASNRTRDAHDDENTIVFTKGQMEDFLAIKNAIQDNLAKRGDPMVINTVPNFSKADELAKLKQLFDDGILSESEFSAEKSKLLSD
jgi:Domain of unknown function (DUF4429)/Short C-terminal domain